MNDESLIFVSWRLSIWKAVEVGGPWRLLRLSLVAAYSISAVFVLWQPIVHAMDSCDTSISGSGHGGSYGTRGTKECGVGTPGNGGGTGYNVPPTKVMDCGPARVQGSVQGITASACATVINDCAVADPARLSSDPHVTTTATVQQQPDGSWQLVAVNCTAVSAQPQVTVAMVEEEFRKRVPSPGIGVAPEGDTLVNIETVLWVNTGRGPGTGHRHPRRPPGRPAHPHRPGGQDLR